VDKIGERFLGLGYRAANKAWKKGARREREDIKQNNVENSPKQHPAGDSSLRPSRCDGTDFAQNDMNCGFAAESIFYV
jgi:hypothetical protein